ncbi:MAG: asparagine synthetase B [Nitrososphaerota archaeon]|nr:asparagine synthetase B [Aigarchaeota archaeon]MDW8076301.1 asparagine synthetase B [Nitrososphaerota archaeon]
MGKRHVDVTEITSRMLRMTSHPWLNLNLWIDGDLFYIKRIEELERLTLRGKTYLCSNNLSIFQDSVMLVDGEIYDIGGWYRIKELFTMINVQELSKMKNLDGNYAFAIIRDGNVILARDPIGTRPLYIASDSRGYAFATERKVLLAANFQNVRSLKPGHAIIINEDELLEFEFCNLLEEVRVLQPFIEPPQEMATILLKNLSCAVKKMIKGKSVGVLFSGGLDSAIIAKLSYDLGVEPELLCAGFPTSKDVLRAKRVAELLGLRINICELSEREIEEALPHVVRIIERRDVLDVSISLPLYFALCVARKVKLDRVLVGQGADEIFAGYKRYERIVEEGGYELLRDELLKDFSRLHEKNLERDYNIYLANFIEPAYPYLDVSVVKCAFQIPVEEKLKKETTGYSRKHILRIAAKLLGMPGEVVNMSKVAIQYGSGVWKIVRRELNKM